MANKKIRLSKPSKSTSKLSYKVRFKFESKSGHFVVTNTNGKILHGKSFNKHSDALEYAKELDLKSKSKVSK